MAKTKKPKIRTYTIELTSAEVMLIADMLQDRYDQLEKRIGSGMWSSEEDYERHREWEMNTIDSLGKNKIEPLSVEISKNVSWAGYMTWLRNTD